MQSNGLPLRADDHGNTAGTATVLSGASGSGVTDLSVSGVIERPTDVDTFAFSAGAGTATFSIAPAARSANLDARVTLRDAAGTLLASVNPTDALGASFSVMLPAAGAYYLSVQGTGKGDPLGTGYTKYGSVGQYGVGATVPTSSSQAPVAVITASTLRGTAPLTVSFSGAGSSDADGSIVGYAWTFGDTTSGSGVTSSHVYTTPGSYAVGLLVTDDSGLSATSSVTVIVDPPVTLPTMRVADIAMSLKVGEERQCPGQRCGEAARRRWSARRRCQPLRLLDWPGVADLERNDRRHGCGPLQLAEHAQQERHLRLHRQGCDAERLQLRAGAEYGNQRFDLALTASRPAPAGLRLSRG